MKWILKLSHCTVLASFALLFFSCKQKNKDEQEMAKAEVKKPNVILILVDDQGYGDVGALGNTHIKTPNIDALHAVSARFTDYHVSPTCSPTRAALLTGHHSNRTGVWHTVNGRSLILERETIMAQIFKENGYRTAIFGKWHLGDNYPFRPQDKGFEEVLVHGGGGIEQTMDYWDNDLFNDTYLHNGKLEKYEGYCTDIWFENAKNYIEKNKEAPFFCYLPTNAAHSPYFVDDTYSNQYKDNDEIHHAAFYGMISNIDENIGKLVDYLKSVNLMDNTILVFTTDNGTAQGAKVEGHRLDGFVVKGNNAGMRGIKASMYEGGHRVPLFIHWKDGGISVGKDINALTAHYDVLPTLVDLCKLKVDENIRFDGQSLKPLINDDDTNFIDRFVVTNSQRVEVPEPWRRTAVMWNNWRLINGTELYDLNKDPEQRNNVADESPDKIGLFKSFYKHWWDGMKPSFADQPRIIIGNPAENPSKLYCHDWHTESVSPWHQRHIRSGYKDNGYWMLKVDTAGTYKIRLRRWPAEAGLALGDAAPVRPALESTSVKASKPGKALAIQKARLKIQDKELSQPVNLQKAFVEFEVNLEAGNTNLQTWFQLKSGDEIGAYFVDVERI